MCHISIIIIIIQSYNIEKDIEETRRIISYNITITYLSELNTMDSKYFSFFILFYF